MNRIEGITWTKCGNGFWRGYAPNGKMYIVAPRNGFRAYSADAPGWCGPWSKNQAEAKKVCEAHYRAALFGSDWPLVRIVDATTPEAAPSEKQAHNHG